MTDPLETTFHCLLFCATHHQKVEWSVQSFASAAQPLIHNHHEKHDQRKIWSSQTSMAEFLDQRLPKNLLLLFLVQEQIFHSHFLCKCESHRQNKSSQP